MTAPERLMTYCGPIDHLPYRVPERSVGLRSRMGFNTRAISSKMKIRHAFRLCVSCYPLDPSRLAPAQPSHKCSAPIEIP
jgi:hypothetical protein